MIFGSLLLIFAAIGLAVLGVVQDSNALLVGSIAASLLAAVALVVGARQSSTAPVVEEIPAEAPRAARAVPVGVGAPAATTGGPAPARSGNVLAIGAAPAVVPAELDDEVGPVGTVPAPTAGDFDSEQRPDPVAYPEPPQQRLPPEYPEPAQPLVAPIPQPDNPPPGAIPVQAGPDAFPADPIGSADPAAVYSEFEYTEDDPPGEPAVEPASRAERDRAAQLDAEVVVLDGHPRYHLADCLHLKARQGLESLPLSEAEELGFSPCSACAPLRTLLAG